MASYSVLPQELNVSCVSGDEFNMLLDFDVNLSGYTVSTSIYDVAAVQNGIVTLVLPRGQFTITTVDAAAGQINLSLNENQTEPLLGSHRWYLRWVAPGGVTRTILSGSATFVSP